MRFLENYLTVKILPLQDTSIEGTFIGSFVIGSLEAGIVAAGLSGFWTQFVCGVLIIASVTIHTLAKRRK